MSEFNQAFINFVEYILQYKAKYSDFTGIVLGNFKKNSHAAHYNVLKREIGNDITMESILIDLVAFYNTYALNEDPANIHTNVGRFLEDCLSVGFGFTSSSSGKISFQPREINSLKKIKTKWNEPFNEPQTPLSNNLNNSDSLQLILNKINDLSERVKSIELNKPNNTTSTSKLSTPSFNDIGIDQETGIKFERLINKKLRYENHKNGFLTNLSNETSPSAYWFHNFPRPLLSDDEDFIKMHNARIKEAQIHFMKTDIEFLERSIATIESTVHSLKDETVSRNSFDGDIDSIVVNITKQVDQHLILFYSASSEKMNRKIEMRYYTVREKNKKFIDSNVSTQESNRSPSPYQRASKRNRSKSNQRRDYSTDSVYNNTQRANHQKSNSRYPIRKQLHKQYNSTNSAFCLNIPNLKQVNFASTSTSASTSSFSN